MSRPSITCRHCGSTATETASGIGDSAHFPDLVYKRCLACGHEEVLSMKRIERDSLSVSIAPYPDRRTGLLESNIVILGWEGPAVPFAIVHAKTGGWLKRRMRSSDYLSPLYHAGNADTLAWLYQEIDYYASVLSGARRMR